MLPTPTISHRMLRLEPETDDVPRSAAVNRTRRPERCRGRRSWRDVAMGSPGGAQRSRHLRAWTCGHRARRCRCGCIRARSSARSSLWSLYLRAIWPWESPVAHDGAPPLLPFQMFEVHSDVQLHRRECTGLDDRGHRLRAAMRRREVSRSARRPRAVAKPCGCGARQALHLCRFMFQSTSIARP